MSCCRATLRFESCGFSMKDRRTSNDFSGFVVDFGLPNTVRFLILPILLKLIVLSTVDLEMAVSSLRKVSLKSYLTSSIIGRVLTRELRGKCGEGGVLRGVRNDVTRGGGTPASQGLCQECVTNFGKIIFITLSLSLPLFIVLYIEHAATGNVLVFFFITLSL